MPAKSWTDKDERMYGHVKQSEIEQGREPEQAEEIAARTVNSHRREDGRTQNSRTMGTGNPSTDLEGRTVDELYNRARELHIKGRSKMRKAELIESICSRQ